jgi:hypothetical protein
VYFSTSEGDIFSYNPEEGRINKLLDVNLRLDYFGKYDVYSGSEFAIPAKIKVTHNDTFIQSSSSASSNQMLHHNVIPGEFIRVGGQEFRVCMNQDYLFTSTYGTLKKTEIPLCRLDNPFVEQPFDGGFITHTLTDIPFYELNTFLGGAYEPKLGDTSITIANVDGSFNPRVSNVSTGDWIRIGHPTDGETFRVGSISSDNYLQLTSVSDVSVPASVTIASLEHATYEVQVISFTNINLLNNTHLSTGFRLNFKASVNAISWRCWIRLLLLTNLSKMIDKATSSSGGNK